MTVSTVTHLNFRGEARDALAFYHSVFGGQQMIATYGEVGVPQDGPDTDRATFTAVTAGSPDADHVAFGMVAAENGFRIAAYDVFGTRDGGASGPGHAAGTVPSPRASGLTHDESCFVLLNGGSLEEITPLWDGLATGGTVIQALAPSDWAPAYGMLTDRFAVTWIFGVAPA